MTDLNSYEESLANDLAKAEALIEELVKERDTAREYAGEVRIREKVADDARIEAEAKLAKAVEALKSLHHAVCGETGFASAVRNHSGKAYPWEPLDIADAQTRAVLAELEGK
jgi:hypothetical protein